MPGTTEHVDYLKRLTADLRRTRRRVAEWRASSPSRSPSSAWRAATPVASNRRRTCGNW